MSRRGTEIALVAGMGVGTFLGVMTELGSDVTAKDQLRVIEDCVEVYPLIDGTVTDDLYGCVDAELPNDDLIDRDDAPVEVEETMRWLEGQDGINPLVVAGIATLVTGIAVGIIKISSPSSPVLSAMGSE